MFALDGAVSVVTGASQGIGAAVVDRFVAAGATVVGVDVQEASAGHDHHVVDVARDEQVRAAIARVHERYGRIDVVVNNAGVALGDSDIVGDSDAAYLRAYRVNVLGAVHVIRAAVEAMPAGSSIVNVASVAALMGSPRLGGYAASKAALMSLTRTAAVELAPRSIRVNAIAPGGTDTAMLEGGAATAAERSWIAAAVPLPRLIAPAEVAASVHFLASPDAAMITGQCLVIDGGATLGPSVPLLDLLQGR